MPRDELRQPLRKRSTAERLWARRPGAITVASVLTLALFAGGSAWLIRKPHPFAGEPIVTAAIPPVEELHAAAIDKAPAPPAADSADAAAGDPPADDSESLQAAPADVAATEPAFIMPIRRPLKPAPFQAITETTPDGPLPKIGNGKTPAQAYAQITPMNVLYSDRPKIAIVLGGMGLNARLTQKAIKELPGAVTLAFAPYGNDLQATVNKARAEGHEVMLQLPMEPPGYPANNPGPNTLLADASPADNLKALRWNMSRFAGYIGITNYLGGRFLSVASSLQPVMQEMKARGLLYLQDATIISGTTDEMSQATGLKSRHAELVLDSTEDVSSIQTQLAELEQQARSSGMAVATGSGLEVTIDTVADWAKDVETRGFVLVPISAFYQGRRS
jgi:uncharacterized protein